MVCPAAVPINSFVVGVNSAKRQAVAEFLVEKANNFVRGNTGGYKFDYMIPFIAALFTTSVFSNLISLLGLRSSI